MFGQITTAMRMSQASSTVREVLASTAIGPEDLDIKDLSSKLVVRLYASQIEVFDGKRQKRPHQLATAAAALGQGLDVMPDGYDDDAQLRVFIALGKLLMSASTHSSTYKFGGYDVPLLKMAERSYWQHEERTREATDRMVGSLGL